MRIIPNNLWKQAERQAERSTVRSYRTGCILVDPRSAKIVANGCSHHGPERASEGSEQTVKTIHAEQHAVRSIGRKADGLWALIVTLNRTGNQARCSRPCAACARMLYRAGVEYAVFYELDKNGIWHERRESLESLVIAAANTPVHEYARRMRLTPCRH